MDVYEIKILREVRDNQVTTLSTKPKTQNNCPRIISEKHEETRRDSNMISQNSAAVRGNKL